MPLSLEPNVDGGPADFNVMHGGLLVGRLYKRASTSSIGVEWLWALNGLPVGPPELAIAGLAATREEALSGLAERLSKWLEWANMADSPSFHLEGTSKNAPGQPGANQIQ